MNYKIFKKKKKLSSYVIILRKHEFKLYNWINVSHHIYNPQKVSETNFKYFVTYLNVNLLLLLIIIVYYILNRFYYSQIQLILARRRRGQYSRFTAERIINLRLRYRLHMIWCICIRRQSIINSPITIHCIKASRWTRIS